MKSLLEKFLHVNVDHLKRQREVADKVSDSHPLQFEWVQLSHLHLHVLQQAVTTGAFGQGPMTILPQHWKIP